MKIETNFFCLILFLMKYRLEYVLISPFFGFSVNEDSVIEFLTIIIFLFQVFSLCSDVLICRVVFLWHHILNLAHHVNCSEE